MRRMFIILCGFSVFLVGEWQKVSQIQDPRLKQLGSDLMDVSLSGVSQATLRTYIPAYKRWKMWAANFPEVVVFPVEPLYLALYLRSLMQTANSPAPINNVYYAISWVHNLVGVADPTRAALPKLALEAAKRLLSRETRKKEPFTTEMLLKCYHEMEDNLKDLRFLTMCVIAFAAFLRYDELSSLRRCDIKFHDKYFDIFIERAKTDVYRDGATVLIAKTDTKLCPYVLLQRYLRMADIREDSDEYIFRAVTVKGSICFEKGE